MFLPGENSLEKRRCFCTYFSRLFFPLLYHAIEYSLKFFVFSYVCSSSRSTLLVSLVATAIQVDLVLCVLKTTPQSLRRHLDFLSLKFLNFLMIAPIDPIAPYYSFSAAIAIHIDLIFMCVEILKLRFHDCCFLHRYLIDDCWICCYSTLVKFGYCSIWQVTSEMLSPKASGVVLIF